MPEYELDNTPEINGLYSEPEEERPNNDLFDFLDDGNLAEMVTTTQTTKVLEYYRDAIASMERWKRKYKRAINLSKMQATAGDVEIEKKSFPFEGASVVMMPYILEAQLDFIGRAAPELVWQPKIAAAKISGKNDAAKEARAERVSKYVNYQLTESIPSWRKNQDKGLMSLPCTGTFYKKTYYDSDRGDARSDLKLADAVIFDMGYDSFEEAPDKFERVKFKRNEVITFIRGEQKWLMDESDLEEDKESFEFIEAYSWLDLDDDGLKEPYLLIISEELQRCVYAVPSYDEDTIQINDDDEVVDVAAVDVYTQYQFLPDPEGGPMGMGWGILLGPMFDAINTNIRQLIDAGTIANTASNSGFINTGIMGSSSSRGNRVDSGPVEMVMGQFTKLQVGGSGTLAQNIVQPPFAGPNPTLFQLASFLIDSARSMTNAAVNVEANAGEAASLYMARLQQGYKVPNMIIMRTYDGMKSEMKKIGVINHKYFDDDLYQKVLDEDSAASMEADFNPGDCDVALVADPSQGSDLERISRATTLLEEAKTQPQQILNLREIYLQWLGALKVIDIEKIAPEPDPNAVDPNQQLMLAQQQMDAEFRNRDQKLRENEQRLKEQKLALEAAREMSKLGLNAEEQEAKIAKLYAETLQIVTNAGIASGENAIQAVQLIEDQFIGDAIDSRAVTVPENDSGSSGHMAQSPGNEGLPGIGPMA